jgi:hypothetical protein
MLIRLWLAGLVVLTLALQGGALARTRPVLRINQVDISKPPQVRVYLTDLDSTLNPITDRKAQHYRLAVDAVPHSHADKVERFHATKESVAVTLVIQVSTAMRDVLTEAVEASKRLVDSLPRGSRVGLVAYTDVVLQQVKPKPAAEVKQAIDALRIREDALEVQLPDAIKDSLEGLGDAALPKQRMVVVFSDGLTTELNYAVFSELGRRAQDKGVIVHSIGYAPLEPARLRTLHELSKAGGGTVREVKEAAQVSQAFGALQEEIRNQLRLTYAVPKAFDGKLHDFQIETPGGQLSNIVALELPVYAPEASSSGQWYKRPWFLVVMIALGQIGLVLAVLAVLRWRRGSAKQRAVARGQYLHALQAEEDEEEDGEEEEEEEEDYRHRRRTRREDGESLARGGRGADVEPSERLRIRELMEPDPALLDSKPLHSDSDDLADTHRQLPAVGAGGRAPTPVPLAPRATTPTPAPVDATVEASVEEPPPTRPGRKRPPSGGLMLPDPDEFIRQQGEAEGGRRRPPSEAEPLEAIPHPDEFLRRIGANVPAPPAPAAGGSQLAKKPASGAIISGSGIPMPQSGQVVPVGVPAEAGVQPGMYLDRKTKVMAVEDMGRLEHVAWIVQLGAARVGTAPRTVQVHDGFVIGSDPACQLQLVGEGIFPQHGVLTLDQAGFRLETVGSRGETLSQLLTDNALFFVGDHEFVFKIATRGAMLPVASVRLEVLEGMDEGRSIALPEREAVTIGSHVSCDLVVRGEGVEGRHAIAMRTGRVCTFSDLGTANGIGYQGQQVGYQNLRSGEEVVIGSVRLVYTYTEVDQQHVEYTDEFKTQKRILE